MPLGRSLHSVSVSLSVSLLNPCLRGWMGQRIRTSAPRAGGFFDSDSDCDSDCDRARILASVRL